MMRWRLIVATAAIGLASQGALADPVFTPVGDAEWGGSWSQGFQAWGSTTFDIFGVRMVTPGDKFEETTLTNFSDGSWSQAYANHISTPTLAIATGSSTDLLLFQVNFTGEMSEPLTFDIVFYEGSDLWGSFVAEWDGSDWEIYEGTWDPGRAWLEEMILYGPVVPLPAPVALAGVGLLGVVFGRKRLRKLVT